MGLERSCTRAYSTAAAPLPLSLFLALPRLSSSLGAGLALEIALAVTLGVVFAGAATFLSFLTLTDFERAKSLLAGYWATFLIGETDFLTLFDRDFRVFSLGFEGVFLAAFFTGETALTGDFEGDLLPTEALLTDAFATDALATEALAMVAFETDAFATEGLADGLTDAFATEALVAVG